MKQTIEKGIDELQAREDRLRAFLDSATDAFALWDSDLKLVDINKPGMQMIPDRMRRENIIGMHLREFDITRGKDIYDKYKEVIKIGKPYSIDNIIPHPKFGDIYLNIKAFKVGDGMGMIVSNSTERKKAELQLRESEEKFRFLSEQSILGIAILQDGLVKYINNACAEIIGYSPEEMMNWPPDEFGKAIHPDDRPFVLEQARKKQLGDQEVVTHYSYRIRTKSTKLKWI